MESGFGQNLEGFLIKGNLSLAPSANPTLQGDGSIEGSGILYFDSIQEYNYLNGVNIQDVSFKNGQLLIPYTIPSDNATSASVIVDGGVSFKHTQNASSITSGGGLTVVGGVSIGKDLLVGGIIDVNNNFIKNVAYPINQSDAANKQYVDDQKFTGNFTTGQLLIADSNGDAIRGYDNLTYDGYTIQLSSTKNITGSVGGSFVCYGGVSISKDVFIGGILNVNNNIIQNVAYPILPTDAANKQYVDDHKLEGNFTTGQVIIAETVGDQIRGYDSFTYDGSVLTLGTNSSILISNTQNAISLTSSGVFTVEGGVCIKKDIFVGGNIDVTENFIKNVATPVDPLDATNKEYVDQVSTRLSGNFTTGQIIIAESDGDAIRGYNNIIFDDDGTTGNLILNPNTNIVLQNTSDSAGLGYGSLTSLGGASFDKSVFIGGQLDVNTQRITNVSTPLENFDAVNKAYVDALFNSVSDTCCTGETGDEFYENTFILNNNVTLPEDITDFNFDNSIKAFISYIYVQIGTEKNAFYTIRGIKTGSGWKITPTYIGQNTGVDFYIRTDLSINKGILQYTNSNYTGINIIKFRTITEIDDIAGTSQTNLTLTNNITDYQNVSGLTFLNSQLNSVKVVIYVSDNTNEKFSLYFLNCLLKDDEWVMNSYFIGDTNDINFRIINQNSIGQIQYINTNLTGDYTIRYQQYKILKSLNSIELLANTFIPNVISDIFIFNGTSFQLTIYVEILELSKYALYEIEGYLQNDVWKINTRYVGDRTGIIFSIDTFSGDGYLKYTNSNSFNARIRYLKDVPLVFEPLPVSKGGTGNTELEPYAVLRGNGTDPIVGTADFIYKDYELLLGNQSSIILQNTTPAINLTSGGTITTYGGVSIKENLLIGNELTIYNTSFAINLTSGGTITTYGGVSIGKNLLIGEALIVKDIDITPSIGDISAERSFNALNNQQIPDDVVDFNFSNVNVKSFSGIVCVTVTTYNDEYDTLYEFKGLRKASGWILNTSYIGDNINIKFYITQYGQIQYTSPNIYNWISTKIKFRAMTTTY
jgi:hypothetical protein